MSNWEKVEEEGMEIWVNEDLGNIYKLQSGEFMAMIPRVLKFGPFKTTEDGQKFLETKKQEIAQALDVMSDRLVTGE